MKKSVSIILLIILMCSACFPAFAQQSRSPRNSSVRGAIAEYERINAFTDGQGVFIRWEMSSELGNIGFLVYRVGGSGLEPAGPGMIMGSASKSTKTLYGESYEMYDPLG